VTTERQLIWMASVSWDGIRGTDRHLATAMSRHARILWVDPPVSPVTSSLRRGAAERSLKPRLSVINERITRLTPVALPGFSRRGVRMTTAPLVRHQVKETLGRLGIQPYAVVATHLDDVLGHWGADVLDVLYCTDDYVAGAELMNIPARRLRRHERRALARADVVAAVSPQLAQRWTDLGARPVVIPNGCWPARPVRRDIPPGVPDLPRPVVGLVGQLSERIDVSVLEEIARAGLSLLIVGPVDPRWERQRFQELITRPEVHYAGSVSADLVPSYLAALDIGITPYQDSPFNRASFPLKTLEYLGAGLPVVSADLPAARWLREDLGRQDETAAADQILALARTGAQYADAIRAMTSVRDLAGADGSVAKADRDQARADQCSAFADRHSWSSRGDAFAAAIGLA
jgi:teichuronic acid biosynthesis glycosyltransferase TuaH